MSRTIPVMIRIDHFFALVETFSQATGLAEATISTRLFNDGGRIQQLRAGGDVGLRKIDKALQYLSDNWPPDTAWPSDIERPQVTEAAR